MILRFYADRGAIADVFLTRISKWRLTPPAHVELVIEIPLLSEKDAAANEALAAQVRELAAQCNMVTMDE